MYRYVRTHECLCVVSVYFGTSSGSKSLRSYRSIGSISKSIKRLEARTYTDLFLNSASSFMLTYWRACCTIFYCHSCRYKQIEFLHVWNLPIDPVQMANLVSAYLRLYVKIVYSCSVCHYVWIRLDMYFCFTGIIFRKSNLPN